MLSRNLEQTLHRALNIAGEYRHEFATLEHLLLSLIDDPDAISVLRACEVNLDKVQKDVSEFLEMSWFCRFWMALKTPNRLLGSSG